MYRSLRRYPRPLKPLNSDSVHRLLEEAADELARLDTLCRLTPHSVSRALWLAAVGTLAGSRAQGLRQLAVVAADPASAGAAAPDVVASDPDNATAGLEAAMLWSEYLAEEERRARGGAPLTYARLERAVGLGLVALPVARRTRHEALDAALHGTRAADRGAALLRALAMAAEVEDRALADAAGALMLCAAGRMDVVRLLPFTSIDAADTKRALAEWDRGNAEPWQGTALTATASTARACRSAVEASRREMEDEPSALDHLGRAAITARRALEVLRADLATTVGALAESIDVSIPAAGDALRRLEESGLVTELTGRRRGRVYGYTAALRAAGDVSR